MGLPQQGEWGLGHPCISLPKPQFSHTFKALVTASETFQDLPLLSLQILVIQLALMEPALFQAGQTHIQSNWS